METEPTITEDIKETPTRKKSKKNLFYNIFYAVAITVLVITSNVYYSFGLCLSFFEFLVIVIIPSIFIVLSIQNYFEQITVFGKIFSIVYFNLHALVYVFASTLADFFGDVVFAVFFLYIIFRCILLLVLGCIQRNAQEKYLLCKSFVVTGSEPLVFLLMSISQIISADF